MSKKLCGVCQRGVEYYSHNMCQTCYRKQLEKYKYWREDKSEMYQFEWHYLVVDRFLIKKQSKERIANDLNMTVRNVNYIIKKHCYRCDKNGKRRPF